MNDTLEVKRERVLAAAAKCGDAKNVLRELFPEAFAEPPFAIGQVVYRDGDRTKARAYLGCDEPAHAYFQARHGFSPSDGAHVFTSCDYEYDQGVVQSGDLSIYQREAK